MKGRIAMGSDLVVRLGDIPDRRVVSGCTNRSAGAGAGADARVLWAAPGSQQRPHGLRRGRPGAARGACRRYWRPRAHCPAARNTSNDVPVLSARVAQSAQPPETAGRRRAERHLGSGSVSGRYRDRTSPEPGHAAAGIGRRRTQVR